MPRRKRLVIPGAAHHVTQRGVRRQNVFFNNDDRQIYLSLLQDYACRYGVEILSYCLIVSTSNVICPLSSTVRLCLTKIGDYHLNHSFNKASSMAEKIGVRL